MSDTVGNTVAPNDAPSIEYRDMLIRQWVRNRDLATRSKINSALDERDETEMIAQVAFCELRGGPDAL